MVRGNKLGFGGISLAATVAVVLLSSPAAAGPEKGKTFDDWTIECKGADKAERCFASQTQIAKEQNNARVLKISVGYLGPKGEPTVVLFVPLGIAVQAGVGIKIGDKPQTILPVLQCLNEGCLATGILDAQMSEEIQKTNSLAVGFMPFGSDKTMTIPVSLKGFAAAFHSLK